MKQREAIIYVPHGVGEEMLDSVLERASGEFGGFTTVEATGGWVNPSGELIKEPVTLVKVAGADESWAQSTAQWVANETDEDEVMWQVSDVATGFEK